MGNHKTTAIKEKKKERNKLNNNLTAGNKTRKIAKNQSIKQEIEILGKTEKI
ncbi:hypothetical protein NG798_06285 [Ancylothrix sp. C2]|nr:hypothetical protein [Ancylothrix sp. D3o]